jgi:xanthine/CO dehydrogenase XdhC/CoxF family maturation factor
MADERVFGAPEEAARLVDDSACALALVMNRDYEQDRACVAALLASRARYIGLLGPRHRSAQLLAYIGRTDDARIHAPVERVLGAETPAEIGLAVVAEIQAVLAGATTTRLREPQRGANVTMALSGSPRAWAGRHRGGSAIRDA